MKKYTHRTISGVSAAAIAVGTVGSAVLTIGSAAAAAPTLPACDATASDVTTNASLATYNTSAVANYKAGSAYKALKAKVTTATATLKKANAVKATTKAAKAAKAKKVTAATKALNTAKSNESKGIAAISVKSASGTALPAAVPANLVNGDANWTFGQYTTRVFVRNGAMIELCYSIDEGDDYAHSDLDPVTHMTSAEKLQSISDYQLIDLDFDPSNGSQIELLPSLRTEALKSPAKSRAAVTTNLVNFLQVNGIDADASDVGAFSGATYTIRGFHLSLQAALIAANVPA